MKIYRQNPREIHFLRSKIIGTPKKFSKNGPVLYLGQKNYRNCSARDWERSGLLEENPQSGCTEIRASLKGPL
jgi:hypothetical protein